MCLEQEACICRSGEGWVGVRRYDGMAPAFSATPVAHGCCVFWLASGPSCDRDHCCPLRRHRFYGHPAAKSDGAAERGFPAPSFAATRVAENGGASCPALEAPINQRFLRCLFYDRRFLVIGARLPRAESHSKRDPAVSSRHEEFLVLAPRAPCEVVTQTPWARAPTGRGTVRFWGSAVSS
jgi:hypothetical protein